MRRRREINKCAEYLNIICGKKGLRFACPEGKDLPFEAGYKHKAGHDCKDCGVDGLVAREFGERMVVHYGPIASGNLDVRDSEIRQLSDDRRRPHWIRNVTPLHLLQKDSSRILHGIRGTGDI